MRGNRALTLYAGIWNTILDANPDLETLDWNAVWGFDRKHDWTRVDPDKINIVSLMKLLKWYPSEIDLTPSAARFMNDTKDESYWKRMIEGISLDGMNRFAAFVKSDSGKAIVSSVTKGYFADPSDSGIPDIPVFIPDKKQPAPAEWGSW